MSYRQIPDGTDPAIRAAANLTPMYEDTYESAYEVTRDILAAAMDPALGPDRLVVAGPYEQAAERATALAERYGEAIIAISQALPNINRVRLIIAGLDTEANA